MTSATAYLMLLFNTLVFCLVLTSMVSQQTIPNITLFSVPPIPILHPKVGTIHCAQFRSILLKPFGITRSSFVSWSLQNPFFLSCQKESTWCINMIFQLFVARMMCFFKVPFLFHRSLVPLQVTQQTHFIIPNSKFCHLLLK